MEANNFDTVYVATESVIDPQKIQFENEKKEMRSTCNKLGLMIIIATVVFMLFSMFVYISYSIFAGNKTLPSFIDSIPDNIISGLGNVAAIGICGLAFIKFFKIDLSTALPFKKISAKKLFSVVAIGFTVCMISNIMTSLYLEITASLGVNLNFDIEMPVSDSFIEILVYFLSTAIVPTFSEEILFRGAVLSSMRKYGDGFAIFVSSAVFGLFHGNFVQIPFTFIVGLVLAWSVVYTNSMLPAIIIHAANNGFSVLSDILYTNAETLNINESIIDFFSIIIIVGVAVIALVAVIKLSKRDKNFTKPKNYSGILDRKTRTKMLVTSPTIIISTVLLLLESITTHFSV
ncbi:MAG: CPBP family intramembrane metalloprotease [Ruminococcus sp.]|nr:CPBP family intramembrane metalloprotease [Ruminococcus sp.]